MAESASRRKEDQPSLSEGERKQRESQGSALRGRAWLASPLEAIISWQPTFSGRPSEADIQFDHGWVQDLKLRYYDLMIQLALQDDAYLDACKAYQEVWDTEEVKEDEAKCQEVSPHQLSHPISGMRLADEVENTHAG